MSLMVWFRKNNKKLMAVVVIALMVVFTIDPIMSYLNYRRGGGHKAFATYYDNKKITQNDRVFAQKQLEILKELKIDYFLRPQDPQRVPTQDLRNVLLGELIFAERTDAAESISYLRQIINREALAVSDKQINAIYDRTYPPDIYWLLLVREARQAGVATPLEMAKRQIEEIVPRIQKGLTYPMYLGSLTKRHEVSEGQVLETFADMMGVIEYAKIMCSQEDITTPEVLVKTNLSLERMDVEYVILNWEEFSGNIPRQNEKRIKEQFEKYKDAFEGEINESNPYGFGYKLPDRVGLEYIAVRMDDVASTIAQPTQQETEDFYQQPQNLSRFTERVPLDPNDPNSQLTTRTRSYPEVAGAISRSLYQQRVDSKTEQILLDAKSITEANMPSMEGEQVKISDEEIREKAGSYKKTAADMNEKYKIKVYAGKTGLLTAADIQGDKILGALYIEGVGFANVGLSRVVFAVEPLKASVLGPVDIRTPRLYENIGPLKDVRQMTQGFAGKNMLLVRVITTEPAAAPQSLDQKIDRRTVRFDNENDGDVNTVKELVTDDLNHLMAMKRAGAKASELVKLTANVGWDTAIEKLNKYHAKVTGIDANETSETFTLENRSGIRRVTPMEMIELQRRYEGDPMARELLFRNNVERLLIDELYSLVPADANALPKPGVVVEFKPTLSYYCIKDMVIHRIFQEQYDRAKGTQIARDEFNNAQVLAAVHYNPQNIIKRMSFQLLQETESSKPAIPKEQDTNKPSPVEGNETAGQ